MLFPASGITFDRWSVWVRLASYFDPFGTTRTVDTQFSLAWRRRTRLIRMTRAHALMATFLLNLHASFTTTVFHKFFRTIEAFASWVTYFLALVTALELNIADLTTVWNALVAELISHELFAAIAETSH